MRKETLMKFKTLFLAALVAALLAMPAAQAQEDAKAANLMKKIMDERAPSVVSVKFVLKVQVTMQGRTQDREENREVQAVVIDKLGLCMTSNTHFGLPRRVQQMMRRQNVEISAVPTDMKVLFGNEAEEYDAQLVLKDSKLGLAFVQILDLKGRTVKPVDLVAGGKVATVGQDLYAIGRLGRAFDCAPRISKAMVSAYVEKPRKMWGFSGSVTVGLPVFDATGAPVGVVAVQEGSEGVSEDNISLMGPNQSMAPFILPLDTIGRTLTKAGENGAMAIEQAAEAAEEATEATEEATEEKPAEEPADKPEEKPEEKPE
jgi:S1-C subfamily serine protease